MAFLYVSKFYNTLRNYHYILFVIYQLKDYINQLKDYINQLKDYINQFKEYINQLNIKRLY